MKQARDVLILIEHVDRELDAVAELVVLLEERHGLRAEVRNFYSDMRLCLERYEPAVVATPFFYFLDHHPMKDFVAAWPKAAFVNLAWEQILYTMNKAVKAPKDEFARTRVRHICWTKTYSDFIQELGVAPAAAHLTGNPVMKFYDAPYRDYFVSRAELAARHGLDERRKWVLFPENYRWAFLAKSQVKAFLKQGADLAFIEAARDYCLRSLTTFFEWIARLDPASAPHIILRPRPATSAEAMIAFMRAAAPGAEHNIRIIKAESARDWILASDQVMSSYSTTLIEASLAGKPLHVFSPEPFPDALDDVWYQHAPTVETEDAFRRVLLSAPDASAGRPLETWARQTLLPVGDPFLAIADAIAAAHAATGAPATGRAADHARPWLFAYEAGRKVLQGRSWWHDALRRRDRRYSFTLEKHEKDVFSAVDVSRRVVRRRTLGVAASSAAAASSIEEGARA